MLTFHVSYLYLVNYTAVVLLLFTHSHMELSNSILLFSLQLYSRQPDESGHHALCGELRRSRHAPQPLPQLPPASSEYARLQPGEHSHHRPCHGPSATNPRGAAGH